MQLTSEDIIVFTDGASRGNPGPGGWAAILILPEQNQDELKVIELGGREARTTNNRMELRAAIEVLSFLERCRLQAKSYKLAIYTDSAYLVNGITKWIYSWEQRNWVTMNKKPVLNKDRWEQLAELTRKYAERTRNEIQWKLVGGHVGIAGNMRCDEIATAFADALSPELYSGVLKNYSIPNILDITEGALLSEKKEAGKARSAAKAYSYVSFADGAIRTHKTWAECEARVKGVSGARFRKVFSPEDEKRLVSEWNAT